MMNNENPVRNVSPHMWICVKLAVLTFGTLLFKYYGGDTINDITNKTTTNVNENALNLNINVKPIQNPVIVQPTCPKPRPRELLNKLFVELLLKKQCCVPEDVGNLQKHLVPKKRFVKNKSNSSNTETQSVAVNYIVGGLLVTSLSAAILELYRAKCQSKRDRKTKNPLSRKCSLADLTVLKHHRKELVRRESILELPEEGPANAKLGRKLSRPPLRLD